MQIINYNEESTRKLRAADKAEVWEIENNQGWMNEDIMIMYLDHVHTKLSVGFLCALVLDCYKAHRTDNVKKKKANNLRIELIFVPANGTRIYQPLDRRIFGIIMSKLRSMAKSQVFLNENWYAVITEHLLKA